MSASSVLLVLSTAGALVWLWTGREVGRGVEVEPTSGAEAGTEAVVVVAGGLSAGAAVEVSVSDEVGASMASGSDAAIVAAAGGSVVCEDATSPSSVGSCFGAAMPVAAAICASRSEISA